MAFFNLVGRSRVVFCEVPGVNVFYLGRQEEGRAFRKLLDREGIFRISRNEWPAFRKTSLAGTLHGGASVTKTLLRPAVGGTGALPRKRLDKDTPWRSALMFENSQNGPALVRCVAPRLFRRAAAREARSLTYSSPLRGEDAIVKKLANRDDFGQRRQNGITSPKSPRVSRHGGAFVRDKEVI